MKFGGVIHFNKGGICLICCMLCIFYMYFLPGNGTVDNLNDKINLKRLLTITIEAAINGGHDVVEIRGNLSVESKGLTKEGFEDSVTTADFLSHCTMVQTLKSNFPALHVISEETKTDCEEKRVADYSSDLPVLPSNLNDEWVDKKDITVWIDPLDATHEYTEKLYDYVTTMACVTFKGRPIIGVVHKPFSGKTSWAWVDKAKSSDLDPKQSDRSPVKIIISRSHSGQIKDILSKNFVNYELVVAAGAGYKSLEVATGNVDAYLHVTAIKKWDICAGNAIINAVGGKMTTKYNEDINYSDFTNSVNENGLIATVKHHENYVNKL